MGSFTNRVHARLTGELSLVSGSHFRLYCVASFPVFRLSSSNGLTFARGPFSVPRNRVSTLLGRSPLAVGTCRCSVIYGNIRLSSNTMEGREPSIVIGTFRVTNCDRDAIGRGFNTLCGTFRCNTPPRTNVTPNMSEVVVLLGSRRGVERIVTFPVGSGTRSVLLNTPGAIARVRLHRARVGLHHPIPRGWSGTKNT